MKNPFALFGLSAEQATDEALPQMLVDRNEELGTCLDAIDSGANVLLYGDKGVGKTFLARLIASELRRRDEVFPAMVDLAHLQDVGDLEHTIAQFAFPRIVLLQTCVALWKQLLEMPFLDLNKATFQSTDLFDRASPNAFLREIYAHLMADFVGTTTNRANTVGASVVFKGELSEALSQTRTRAPLQPFEFFEFAEVIQNHVLRPLGKTCLVAVCDEANLLPLTKQQDILERYLQLFLAKRIQFVFVASHFPWESLPNLAIAFDTHLELKGWPNAACLREIIRKVRSPIPFEDDAVEYLWQACHGHPRTSLTAMHDAYDQASRSGSAVVDVNAMKGSIELLNKRYAEFTRNWMAIRPPR